MKKMTKVLATVLCLGMVITSLSACTGNTGRPTTTEEPSKPEVVTTTPTEEPTTVEPTITEQPTDEPTVEPTSVEPTQEPTTAGVIPAYDPREESYVLGTAPVNWFDYNQFNLYFTTAITDKTTGNGTTLYRLENWPATISVAQNPLDIEYNGDVFDIGFYVYNNAGKTCCAYEINGEIRLMANFVPLVYDSDAKILFGYTANDDGSNGKFVKMYYSTAFQDLIGRDVEDPSVYGF